LSARWQGAAGLNLLQSLSAARQFFHDFSMMDSTVAGSDFRGSWFGPSAPYLQTVRGRVKGRRGGAPGVCGGRRPEPRRVLPVGNQNPDAKETTHVPTSKTALLTDRCGAPPRQ